MFFSWGGGEIPLRPCCVGTLDVHLFIAASSTPGQKQKGPLATLPHMNIYFMILFP